MIGEDGIQMMIKSEVLQALLALLSSPHEEVKKDACLAISNATAGTVGQVEVFQYPVAVSDFHVCRL